MSEFSVITKTLSKEIDVWEAAAKEIHRESELLNRICTNLSRTGSAADSIKESLRKVSKQMEEISKGSTVMKTTLQDIICSYENTEKKILELKLKIEEKKITYWDYFKEGFTDNFFQTLISVLLETGYYQIASYINILTALKIGPNTANSFVILNPDIASSTSKFIGNASKGLLGLGFAIDLFVQIKGGENTKDAVIKSVAHLGIGVAIGAVLGSIIPGPGTVAGAVAGLVVGALVTHSVNTFFDYIYDNPQRFIEDVEGIWNKVTNVASNVSNMVGNAVCSTYENLGTVFG